MDEFDYLVIGGGSSGCVVAGRLSEDPGTNVALLEAGGMGDSLVITTPAAGVLTVPTRLHNWAFETEPQPGLNGRRGYQPRGKALGGSSAINAMVYTRGHRWDYDHWAALGNAGWSFEEVLPYFKKSECNEDFAGDWHGRDGPLNVAKSRTDNPFHEFFLQAAREAQFHLCEDFNVPEPEGLGIYQITQKNGERWSAARAYIHPHLGKRHNLLVECGARVRRILFEGKRAVGVEFLQRGQSRTFRARREIILSAGAIQSPQILMLSGVGDGEALRRFGITVTAHLPGVGRNLQDHPDFVFGYAAKSLDLLGISFAGFVRLARELRRYQASTARIADEQLRRGWRIPEDTRRSTHARHSASFRRRNRRGPCAQAALGTRLFVPRLPVAATQSRDNLASHRRSARSTRDRSEFSRSPGRCRGHGRRI